MSAASTDRIEAFAREKTAVFLASLAAGTAIIRIAWIMVSAALVNARALDLSFFYDGLAYIHIAQTFPALYGPPPAAFPLAHADPALYTIYLPGFAGLIRLLQIIFGDARLAAFAAVQFCATTAIILFFHAARRLIDAPACATIFFSVFTPTWVLCGALPFAEPLLIALFLASFLLWHDGRPWAAAAVASLAPLSQKSGVFLIALLPAWEYLRNRRMDLRPAILACAPLACLHGYFWLRFDDPFVNTHLLGKLYGGVPIPFYAMIAGLIDSEQIFTGGFWLRKAALAASCAFYVAILAAARRRREFHLRPLLLWLGVALLFNLSLRGMWAYYAFPRFMLWALPPAVILLFASVPKAWAARLAAGASAALPATMTVMFFDLFSAIDLLVRIWKPGFFQALSAYFRA